MNSNEKYNDIVLKDSCSHSYPTANYRSIPMKYTSTYYQCHSYPVSIPALPSINVILTRYQYLLYPLSMSSLPYINSIRTDYRQHFYTIATMFGGNKRHILPDTELKVTE